MDYINYEVAKEFCRLDLPIRSVRFYRDGDEHKRHFHNYFSDCYSKYDEQEEDDNAYRIIDRKPRDWNHFSPWQKLYSAPTYDELRDAIYSSCHIDLCIAPVNYNTLMETYYYKFILGMNKSIITSDNNYESFEDALNEACKYIISLKLARDKRIIEGSD